MHMRRLRVGPAMTPEKHALAKLKIALETGRWEFVQEAYGILDGLTNALPLPEPLRLPPALQQVQRGRAG